VLPGFPFSPAGPSVAVEPLGEVDYAPGHPHEHEGELARNCADERIVGHADSFPMIGDGPPAPGVLLQCLLDRAPEPAHDAGMPIANTAPPWTSGDGPAGGIPADA
jgi:hypothetical protein